MGANRSATTYPVRFLTTATAGAEERQAVFMIESLRAFGGAFSRCPIWVFTPGAEPLSRLAAMDQVEVLPLDVEEPFRRYILADKVFACARAEEMAGPEVRALVWLNLDCLVVNPPALLDLTPAFDAAFRPVHIRNVGALAAEPLDGYWQAVYRVTGAQDTGETVESFVDEQTLRPYFNTHCFAIRPAKGILRAWRAAFQALVADDAFQANACQDKARQIFLHQVVLSALVAQCIDPARICHLPPEYSYPLHLHARVAPARQIHALNDMVCAVYEEPEYLAGIEVREPLKAWLAAHQAND